MKDSVRFDKVSFCAMGREMQFGAHTHFLNPVVGGVSAITIYLLPEKKYGELIAQKPFSTLGGIFIGTRATGEEASNVPLGVKLGRQRVTLAEEYLLGS